MKRRKIARAARGFSLMELVLVLAIIGVLMAVAAVNVFGVGERANVKATKASLGTVKSQLDSYYLEYKEFPPDLRTLVTAKFLDDKKLQDAWKTDFVYEGRPSGERKFTLGSAGPDKQVGTEDDIDAFRLD